ncbi:hypothetical protein BC826DRAFT_966942 [Russula brevipes]|nr:hypothetical protein BC826DRAFT_966942 [Russula brevipes]
MGDGDDGVAAGVSRKPSTRKRTAPAVVRVRAHARAAGDFPFSQPAVARTTSEGTFLERSKDRRRSTLIGGGHAESSIDQQGSSGVHKFIAGGGCPATCGDEEGALCGRKGQRVWRTTTLEREAPNRDFAILRCAEHLSWLWSRGGDDDNNKTSTSFDI